MTDRDTRREVLDQILRNGPISASEISDALGISTAGVRRHLDNIVEDGFAETVEAARTAAGDADEDVRRNSSGSLTPVGDVSAMITTPWHYWRCARYVRPAATTPSPTSPTSG